MRELKVVIADDHPVVLVGLREVIQRDKCFTLVGEALSSSQLVEQLRLHQPALLITDFNMPGDETYGDGLQLIEYLIEHFPEVKILVLTMESNQLIISRLLEMGVAGVIAKNHIYQEIGKALSALASGRSYTRTSTPNTSVITNPKVIDERFSTLSPREVEVLRLFVAGNSVGDIARQLNRSVKTVSTHKVAAMHKLEVINDHALLTYCIKADLWNV
ncbi:response regulator [Pseudomonas psychrophila]|uniref:Two component transcriptional regulator, LuxR family n=1 Tax=Pseudomonas psychrophila TaxID=122355 RepID=A0ABY0W674_9PSED|nr:response regulator [Pseudomonas psychrophila]KAB0490523.1 response regulator [Pseudomonas psychrophila]KMN01214.1 LuxR family transcriptional regulator [Pseudomonas psychrophila]QIE34988.1 response regulator [Pseudomonas psychrophila]WVI97094.1 response regulator [Pseudomonas psychrophila]SDU75069.1 two component transcriptional regulator, LuxR family [Pseudomonas psychrophila]